MNKAQHALSQVLAEAPVFIAKARRDVTLRIAKYQIEWDVADERDFVNCTTPQFILNCFGFSVSGVMVGFLGAAWFFGVLYKWMIVAAVCLIVGGVLIGCLMLVLRFCVTGKWQPTPKRRRPPFGTSGHSTWPIYCMTAGAGGMVLARINQLCDCSEMPDAKRFFQRVPEHDVNFQPHTPSEVAVFGAVVRDVRLHIQRHGSALNLDATQPASALAQFNLIDERETPAVETDPEYERFAKQEDAGIAVELMRIERQLSRRYAPIRSIDDVKDAFAWIVAAQKVACGIRFVAAYGLGWAGVGAGILIAWLVSEYITRG